MIEARIDSGIEITTIRVLRQEPRNSRIISPVSAAAITPSLITPVMAARMNTDWSKSGVELSSLGIVSVSPGSRLRMPSTMSSVEPPLLSIGWSTPRLPSTWTMLVCGDEAVADVGDVAHEDRSRR